MKKVTAGDPLEISAATFNTLIDAGRDYQRRQRSRQPGPPGPGRDFASGNRVLVRNDAGLDVHRFGVLGIDQPIVLPSENAGTFADRVALACVLPDAAHKGQFVITCEPIAAGRTGHAWIDAVCPAKVNVDSGQESATTADVADEQPNHLEAGAGTGATILWKASGTGVVWAVVRLGPEQTAPMLYEIVRGENHTQVAGDYPGAVIVPAKPVLPQGYDSGDGLQYAVQDDATAELVYLPTFSELTDELPPVDEGPTTGNLVYPPAWPSVGERLWVIRANGRLEALCYDRSGITARFTASGDPSKYRTAAYRCFELVDSFVPRDDEAGNFSVEGYTNWRTKSLFLPVANGPAELNDADDTTHARMHFATDRPVILEVHPDVGADNMQSGFCAGPFPSTTYMAPGLPGFIFLDWVTEPPSSGFGGFGWFVRAPAETLYQARATSDWNNGSTVLSVAVEPVLQLCLNKYSATAPATAWGDVADLPTLWGGFNVWIPPVNGKDPNIFYDDWILYRLIGQRNAGNKVYGTVIAGDYYDDAIGTVKLWCGAEADIPPGWRLHSYTQSEGKYLRSVPSGGSVGYGTFGATGSDYQDARYFVIERYK